MTLPRIDLHRHLDGNLRLETVVELAEQHGMTLPGDDVETLRPHLQILAPGPDLSSFLARVELMVSVIADYDACYRVAYENVEDAARERLDYVELRFSPLFMAQAHRLDPEGVVEAVVDGFSSASRELGMRSKLIGILSRTFGPDNAMKELDALLAHRDRIVGLDLAGDEVLWPAPRFETHFRRAREAGWRITVHAGEADSAESVWQALRILGAERIGHGVRATEDPALIEYLLEHRIGIESCLTSNVQTSTVTDYESHPLRSFLERGLLATINTDDPVISGIDLDHELTVAARASGLTAEEVRRAGWNAVEVAFLTRSERDELTSRLNAGRA